MLDVESKKHETLEELKMASKLEMESKGRLRIWDGVGNSSDGGGCGIGKFYETGKNQDVTNPLERLSRFCSKVVSTVTKRMDLR
ncbi:hypothetical protein L1049_000718 [Liquidambar formosana]|uniref:Uncharacterized protein n=1 Tax=Liquidambar formosana TaxID=63359 RepID=A0AAP0N9A3_LIQFO